MPDNLSLIKLHQPYVTCIYTDDLCINIIMTLTFDTVNYIARIRFYFDSVLA